MHRRQHTTWEPVQTLSDTLRSRIYTCLDYQTLTLLRDVSQRKVYVHDSHVFGAPTAARNSLTNCIYMAIFYSSILLVEKMKLVFATFAAIAVMGLWLDEAHTITSVPRWVDDVKAVYAAELKQQIALAPKSRTSLDDNASRPESPADLPALRQELARLQETDEKVRGDRRAIALFATLLMVAVFLIFFFTATNLEEALHKASKLAGSKRQDIVDSRL